MSRRYHRKTALLGGEPLVVFYLARYVGIGNPRKGKNAVPCTAAANGNRAHLVFAAKRDGRAQFFSTQLLPVGIVFSGSGEFVRLEDKLFRRLRNSRMPT